MNLTAQYRDGYLEDEPLTRYEKVGRPRKISKWNIEKQQTIQRKLERLSRELAKEME